MFLFFFFKQKTAYEIPKRDWSSDVCSSDLGLLRPRIALALAREFLVDPDAVEKLHQWEIEDVGPNDRGRAVIAVVVPGAVRGQDQIAARRLAALALDRRIAAILGEDRAAGVRGVPVHRRDIAEVVDRYRAADRRRHLQPAAEAGIDQQEL